MSYAGADGDVVPLNERPKLVALNKVDVPDGRDMAEFVRPSWKSAVTASSKCRPPATRACVNWASPWPRSSPRRGPK